MILGGFLGYYRLKGEVFLGIVIGTFMAFSVLAIIIWLYSRQGTYQYFKVENNEDLIVQQVTNPEWGSDFGFSTTSYEILDANNGDNWVEKDGKIYLIKDDN